MSSHQNSAFNGESALVCASSVQDSLSARVARSPQARDCGLIAPLTKFGVNTTTTVRMA